MHTEYHHWFSHRLGRELGIVVFGHWGMPLLAFPTSGGHEWEYHDRGLIGAIGDLIEAGAVKVFTVDTNAAESLYNKGAHPLHRSWLLRMYDEYVHSEVVPFIHHHCKGWQPIATMGASLGAYYAANAIFKHPDVFKRCYALSGVYDIRTFMDGMYDENVYFNNPVDYLANLSDPWFFQQYATCEIRLVTGTGPWEVSGPTHRLAEILRAKGIPHVLDDWGPQGGHDWPYWTRQMREYLSRRPG